MLLAWYYSPSFFILAEQVQRLSSPSFFIPAEQVQSLSTFCDRISIKVEVVENVPGDIASKIVLFESRDHALD